jgi:hypothetical protein
MATSLIIQLDHAFAASLLLDSAMGMPLGSGMLRRPGNVGHFHVAIMIQPDHTSTTSLFSDTAVAAVGVPPGAGMLS